MIEALFVWTRLCDLYVFLSPTVVVVSVSN